MDKQIINVLKNFLIEKGILNEFCEAFNLGDFDIRYSSIINSFPWGEARKRQRNTIEWTTIDDEWNAIFFTSDFKGNNTDIPNEQRIIIVKELLCSNTNKLLRAISRIRDDL